MTFSEQVLAYYQSLEAPRGLPAGVHVMNPYTNDTTWELCQKFYIRYYDDTNIRRVLLGINPGRFGSGLTGISFTDPIRLAAECRIANELPKKAELSSEFIYQMIDSFGGPEPFYDHYFISSVCPLGFKQKEKNLNYYDLPLLQKRVTPFIIESIDRLCAMNIDRSICFCLGEGKNFSFLKGLNQQHQWFHQLVALPHPRFIMQYKRKEVASYIHRYVETLRTPN